MTIKVGIVKVIFPLSSENSRDEAELVHENLRYTAFIFPFPLLQKILDVPCASAPVAAHTRKST